MKRQDLDKFIAENQLLQNCAQRSGIYAITIDNGVVYVGQSKNIYQRCSQHIYNIENAMFNNEQKYLLLLSAKLGGHKVDCRFIEYCDINELTQKENIYIEWLQPCLNIRTPKGDRDISKLKIEDVLNSNKYIFK